MINRVQSHSRNYSPSKQQSYSPNQWVAPTLQDCKRDDSEGYALGGAKSKKKLKVLERYGKHGRESVSVIPPLREHRACVACWIQSRAVLRRPSRTHSGHGSCSLSAA